ncbi:MAG: sugar transferase [Xanthobacteraceae bacterium]|nr:sugar transferase [Xanthobacteraceae bacterium]
MLLMAIKRGFDILASVIGLLIFGGPILILILIVRSTSPGGGLFAQERVGRDCKPFTCYKIRTMYRETRAAATHEVHASSVTPVGRWLRRLKLDELPQLWNVVRGDMSLVGPRPCLPTQTELINKRLERGVFAIRPGISGKAQVLGVDMSDPDELSRIDSEYVNERTFLGDLAILARTFNGKSSRDRVIR